MWRGGSSHGVFTREAGPWVRNTRYAWDVRVHRRTVWQPAPVHVRGQVTPP